jgi:hypothetical protein
MPGIVTWGQVMRLVERQRAQPFRVVLHGREVDLVEVEVVVVVHELGNVAGPPGHDTREAPRRGRDGQ